MSCTGTLLTQALWHWQHTRQTLILPFFGTVSCSVITLLPRATQTDSSDLMQTVSKSCLDCTRWARYLSLSCWQSHASLQRPNLSGDPQHHATQKAAAAMWHQLALGSWALSCPEQTQPKLATHWFKHCMTIQTDHLYSPRNLVGLEESQTKSLQQWLIQFWKIHIQAIYTSQNCCNCRSIQHQL